MKSYRCAVCRWQGQLESVDAGDAAPCPQCGMYLYPLSWVQTWGVVILMLALALAVVGATALVRRL